MKTFWDALADHWIARKNWNIPTARKAYKDMSTNKTLSEVITIATHKVISADDYKRASAGIFPGTYPVDFRARIHGGIKKGEPYESKIPAAADPWKLLAVALSRLNKATVDSIVTGYFQVSDEEGQAVKDSALAAIEKIVESTKRVCQGKVTSTLFLEMLG